MHQNMFCLNYLSQSYKHNIIQIHNKLLWDSQHFTEYYWTFHEILTVTQNIVMDLNNVIRVKVLSVGGTQSPHGGQVPNVKVVDILIIRMCFVL